MRLLFLKQPTKCPPTVLFLRVQSQFQQENRSELERNSWKAGVELIEAAPSLSATFCLFVSWECLWVISVHAAAC